VYGLITTFITLKVCKEQVTGVIKVVNKSFMNIDVPLREAVYTVNDMEYSVNLTSQEKIPVGAETVTVFYSPSNPKKSYLSEEKPSLTMPLVVLAASSVFMLLGLGAPWVSKQNEEIQQLTVKIIFLVIGLALTTGGVFYKRHENNLRRDCTSQVNGVISSDGHSIKYSNKGKREEYRPWFAYTMEGFTYQRQSNYSTSWPKFTVGQPVTVMYDPADPRRSYLLEEGKSSYGAWFLIGAGLLLMIPTAIAIIIQLAK
jgi:hypothetical protein